MVTTRLEILNHENVPISKNISVSLTFALSDIREPDKRKATFSKTISLLGTNDVNLIFENIFEVNTKTLYFNKNKKTPVKYYVNEILNFKGDLQLLSINILNNTITYDCSVIGDSGSLFVDIGDKYITGNADSADDLDFSAYDHTYDRSTQISTRSNHGTGLGVMYPFIDRGVNGGSDTVWNTTDFLPCVHFYELVKKIIEKTGRTFTSTTVSSAEFKKYLLYPNITGLTISDSVLANRQFYCGLNSDYTLTIGSDYNVSYPNESAPFFDVGAQGFSSNTYFKLNDTGHYNVASHNVYNIDITHTDPSVVIAKFNSAYTENIIYKSVDGGTTWNIIATQKKYWVSQITDFSISTPKTVVNELATGEVLIYSNDRIKVVTRYNYGMITYYDVSNVVVLSGTGTIVVKLKSGTTGSSFYALATQKKLLAGNTLLMNSALPLKIKQKDFLKSVIQALNLYIDIDPNDENNLIIESYDAFYNTLTPINFENKTDLKKPQITNTNALEGKRYIFNYTDDKDFYNELYKKNNSETFGTHSEIIENDFKQNDKENKIIFSPTPNAVNYGLGIAHPRIYSKENNVVKTITPNIRWLISGGVKTSSNNIIYKEDGQNDLVSNEFLYAGHCDDWLNPTIDINFGEPKELFYTFPKTYFTNNNLFNRFHKANLENVTNRDAKIVTKYIWFTPKDLHTFSFRRRIFLDDTYWIVNKIENFNPIEEDSTLFELIKLYKSTVFVPSSTSVTTTGVSTGAYMPMPTPNSSINIGTGNQVLGANSVAIGNNILIPESSTGVTVIGNDVVIEPDTTGQFKVQGNLIVSGSISSINNLYGYNTTTNATPTVITFDGSTGIFALDTNSIYKVYSKIIAVDTATHDYKEWDANGIAKYDGFTASYTNILAVTSTLATGAMTACVLTITSSTAPAELKYNITGIAATNIKWMCETKFLKILI